MAKVTRYVEIIEDDDGNELIGDDITNDVNELLEVNEELTERMEQITLSFDAGVQQGLSLASHPGSSPGIDGRAPIKGRPSKGAATPPGSVSKVGKAAAKVSKGGKAKAASLGHHLMHAAKVVGRSVAKNPGLAGAAGGAGAAIGIHAMSKRLSNDDLSLDEETQEEDLSDMTYDDAVALLESEEAQALPQEDWEELQQAHDEAANNPEETDDDDGEVDAGEIARREELAAFAQNALVADAERRTPKK